MTGEESKPMAEKGALGQEQRLTFRVAVRAGAGVAACLILAGRKLPAVVGDISSEGLYLKLPRGPIPALKVGSMVDVEVSYEDEAVSLYGEIRSQHEGGYGIYFPERDPVGRANPLGKFGRISAQLQRTSLSQRLKILKLPD
jgi:hypothetical protein